MNFNKVLIMGRLTRDLQLSYLPNQTAVVEFGMATNRKWNDKATGEQKEEVCFVDCRCYGSQAETLNKYVHKGDQLFIEGRLQFDTWNSPEGQRRSKHRVFVQSFQFLNKRIDEQAPAAQAGPPAIPEGDIPF